MSNGAAFIRLAVCLSFLFVLVPSAVTSGQPGSAAARTPTKIVLLGTGLPRPDPKRSGPATAIVVNGKPYLIDAGPGIVRRTTAAYDNGIKALAVQNLLTLFITHLHSDHTVGYPDLIFTTWVQGRHAPIKAYGPPGLEAMTKYIMLAWQVDIDVRSNGVEHRDRNNVAVEAHDVLPGVVYEDPDVKITAFAVAHGELQAYGYKFQAPDRTVVISGDTSPSDGIINNCQKCDVLIHEAFSDGFKPADMPNWLEYRSKYHTTTTQLAEIANRTQPGLLIVYHRGLGPKDHEITDEQYLAEIQKNYRGKVVIGHDLDVY
jgi:ribonuclease BN (tRNA processing enzyme)